MLPKICGIHPFVTSLSNTSLADRILSKNGYVYALMEWNEKETIRGQEES